MSKNFSKVLRYGTSLPALLALHSINLPPIEKYRLNRHLKAKEINKPRLPELSRIESEIVHGMERDGVFITSLTDLAIERTDEMVEAALKLSAGLAVATRLPTSGGRRVVDSDPATMANYRALFRWGLSSTALRIAESYLELPPAYDGPKVAYTVADGGQVVKRLWHRDREDRRMVKIAIYLTDVPESGGPLQCLKRKIFDGPINGDFRYPILNHIQLEQQLGRPITDADITSCVGPAGTVVFMDTARLFHRGKSAVSVDRRAVFHSYFSRTPRHPFFCERSDLSRSQLAKFAEEMPSPQRGAVLWRRALAIPMRLVPPSIM